jgi:hypothetical protein
MKKPRASAAFSLMTVWLLAFRADAEKFKFVRDPFEAIRTGNARFNLGRETFLNFNHLRAARANQMMVMAVVAFTHQFKPRRAIAEIKPLHHPHPFQQVHRPVNRRQITPALGHGGKNLLVRKRMRMSPEDFQDCRARAGDLSRLPPQTARQGGQFLSLV